MNESLKFENGKPCVPVLNDRTFPSFLESRRMEKSVSRNSDRLKIFSGTANPTLSKVFISRMEFNYLFFIYSEYFVADLGFYGNTPE